MVSHAEAASVYDDLRALVLNLDPKEIGITQDDYPNPVVALLMETGFSDGSYTLAVVADGSTSMYFSNGGGIIGAGEHDSVRRPSLRLLGLAREFHEKGEKVTTFPKPAAGRVIFYFVTFGGVRAYRTSEDDLGNQRDELSKLFFAAHDVITEARKIEENRR